MEETDKLLLELYNNLGKDKEALSQRVIDYCEKLDGNAPAKPAMKKVASRRG